MTEPRPADVMQLTDPEPGAFVLVLRAEGGELQRFMLNRDQLFELNHQTADILRKAFK